MRMSDWSSDVCSSDLLAGQPEIAFDLGTGSDVRVMAVGQKKYPCCYLLQRIIDQVKALVSAHGIAPDAVADITVEVNRAFPTIVKYPARSEEHTSELQSLMRISYAVFCLKKKKNK